MRQAAWHARRTVRAEVAVEGALGVRRWQRLRNQRDGARPDYCSFRSHELILSSPRGAQYRYTPGAVMQ
jgi:hypothetical protein